MFETDIAETAAAMSSPSTYIMYKEIRCTHRTQEAGNEMKESKAEL